MHVYDECVCVRTYIIMCVNIMCTIKLVGETAGTA